MKYSSNSVWLFSATWGRSMSRNAALYTVMSIPQVVLLSSAFAMIGPLIQTVVPYRLRGLGAAMGSIYVFFFGATGGALIALPLTNAYGPRTTLIVMLIPATIIGGLLIIRSARFIDDDLALVVAEIREEHADQQLRAADPETSEHEIVEIVEREVETGEFPALKER